MTGIPEAEMVKPVEQMHGSAVWTDDTWRCISMDGRQSTRLELLHPAITSHFKYFKLQIDIKCTLFITMYACAIQFWALSRCL